MRTLVYTQHNHVQLCLHAQEHFPLRIGANKEMEMTVLYFRMTSVGRQPGLHSPSKTIQTEAANQANIDAANLEWFSSP